ncbi:MAG: hypothetical protein LLG04_12585 [Parachlamydia sp.]|nr:hypothetical protein [Parachlamydia sp.]
MSVNFEHIPSESEPSKPKETPKAKLPGLENKVSKAAETLSAGKVTGEVKVPKIPLAPSSDQPAALDTKKMVQSVKKEREIVDSFQRHLEAGDYHGASAIADSMPQSDKKVEMQVVVRMLYAFQSQKYNRAFELLNNIKDADFKIQNLNFMLNAILESSDNQTINNALSFLKIKGQLNNEHLVHTLMNVWMAHQSCEFLLDKCIEVARYIPDRHLQADTLIDLAKAITVHGGENDSPKALEAANLIIDRNIKSQLLKYLSRFGEKL